MFLEFSGSTPANHIEGFPLSICFNMTLICTVRSRRSTTMRNSSSSRLHKSHTCSGAGTKQALDRSRCQVRVRDRKRAAAGVRGNNLSRASEELLSYTSLGAALCYRRIGALCHSKKRPCRACLAASSHLPDEEKVFLGPRHIWLAGTMVTQLWVANSFTSSPVDIFVQQTLHSLIISAEPPCSQVVLLY